MKPPSRGRSRPSTPGILFLNTTSLNGSPKHSSNTADIIKSLTPDALNSTPHSSVRIRRPGEPESASRSKTSLTLSLPEEETFGQPSIDLPGLNIARDFGFGLGIGSRTSRIEERRSVVVVVEEMKEGCKESFENVNLDVYNRQVECLGSNLGLKENDPGSIKERRIAAMLDQREEGEGEGEGEGENNRFCGLLKKIWGNGARKCCCS
ncbi:hypothetical protein EYC84_010495 [Monilinia fructicola]|uniref:Uncharacterized protein n=1 Tax=Monilinia fructicola TaxID=38448 RepID=A0A5M9JKA8_MONFR|nr:hypothetical protein EYC84_010495 [Monilinia fructicola]